MAVVLGSPRGTGAWRLTCGSVVGRLADVPVATLSPVGPLSPDPFWDTFDPFEYPFATQDHGNTAAGRHEGPSPTTPHVMHNFGSWEHAAQWQQHQLAVPSPQSAGPSPLSIADALEAIPRVWTAMRSPKVAQQAMSDYFPVSDDRTASGLVANTPTEPLQQSAPAASNNNNFPFMDYDVEFFNASELIPQSFDDCAKYTDESYQPLSVGMDELSWGYSSQSQICEQSPVVQPKDNSLRQSSERASAVAMRAVLPFRESSHQLDHLQSMPLAVSSSIFASTDRASGNIKIDLLQCQTRALPAPAVKRKRNAVSSDHKETQMLDQQGNLIATLVVSGCVQLTREPYSPEKKRMTLKTRRLGACQPCKLSKKRCDRPESPYECCNNCKPRLTKVPCFLAQIIEAQLFRDKPSPKHPRSSLRRQIFESLADIDRRQALVTLTLTQDFGEELAISVAEYQPHASEKTYRVWKDFQGNTRRLELPSYCIANMEQAHVNMLQYIRRFRGAFLRGLLMRSNEITAAIFDQAQQYSVFAPESMVSQALDLCAACRIIERDWRICGSETLGIDIVLDQESPWCGTHPITPMMDAQLDQIVIRSFLTPLREKVLRSLQDKILNFRRDDWFEVFLTISVLLSHAEWLLAHSRCNAVRCGAQTRYNYMPRAESYFHSCKTMLAYFHHICRGSAPLSINWDSKNASSLAELDAEQTKFMKTIQAKIKSRGPTLQKLRDESQYETELYWTHQLFFPEWKPGSATIEPA